MPRVLSCQKDAKKRSERRSQVGKSPARDFLVPSAFNYKKVGRKGEKNGERSELTIPRLVLLAIFFLLYPVFCLFPNAEPGPRLSPAIAPADRHKLEYSMTISAMHNVYSFIFKTDLSKNKHSFLTSFYYPLFIFYRQRQTSVWKDTLK